MLGNENTKLGIFQGSFIYRTGDKIRDISHFLTGYRLKESGIFDVYKHYLKG